MSKGAFTRTDNKMLGGVCSAIANRLGWNILLVRCLYVLLSILSAAVPGIVVYLTLWFVLFLKNIKKNKNRN